MPEELQTEVHDIVQERGVKTISKKKSCKKAKWLSEEALQTAMKKRKVKGKGEKERYTHLNAGFQRIARRDEKTFLSNHCKAVQENNRMGKTGDLIKKIRKPLQYCKVISLQLIKINGKKKDTKKLCTRQDSVIINEKNHL